MPTGATPRGTWAGRPTWAVVDALVWMLSFQLAVWLRYEFSYPPRALHVCLIASLGCAALHVIVGTILGPYRIDHSRGSYEEAFDVARAAAVTTAIAFLLAVAWHPPYLPRSATLTAGAIATLGMFATRLAVRALATRRAWERPAEHRAVVFGAGDAGRRLIRGSLREPGGDLVPVALLDDDPAKARLRIDGVAVRGTRHDLARVAASTGATMLIIAAPHAEPDVKRELSVQARRLGLDLKLLPALIELLDADDDSGSVRSLRDVDVTDLLGRSPVQLEGDVVGDLIRGRRVLVTGAGGSIGSELCRQLSRHDPAALVLLDRDESALLATQMSLTGSGLLDSDDVVLADIRDPEALSAAFRRAAPQIVFHAAALKHQPLLERYPREAWRTNVLGTLAVLEAAADAGVETFVNVSTDKAAAPSCVLGYSKRITERLTAEFARRRPGRYVSVRFGNVLGSRGSVVHTFTEQIDRGGPLTVTDPGVERYFMLIPEACQLVLEAACVGGDGEVMVLDMGAPVSILEVARTLVTMSGRTDVEIVFSGLREGEKLSEDLFSPDETPRPTAHPLVARVDVPPVPSAVIVEIGICGPSVARMRDLAESGPEPTRGDPQHPLATGGTA